MDLPNNNNNVQQAKQQKEPAVYIKILSPSYLKPPEQVVFQKTEFLVLKALKIGSKPDDDLTVAELLQENANLNILDINRFNKNQLQNLVQEFLLVHD